MLAIGFHREHQRQRLGRRQPDVRRAGQHQAPLFERRIARANPRANVRLSNSSAAQTAAFGVGAFE
jgi:hypothetical protein